MMRVAWIAIAGLLLTAPAIAQTAFTPRDESPEEFAAGAGRDETFYACTACHNFKLVAAQGLSRAGWDDPINPMIRRHNTPPRTGGAGGSGLNIHDAANPRGGRPGPGGGKNPFSKQKE